MGLDPTDGDYEEDAACLICKNRIFGGRTPKYVWANGFGIVQCPGKPAVPDDFSVKLTQFAGCRWLGTIDMWGIIFGLAAGLSWVEIGLHPHVAFRSFYPIECLSRFTNQNPNCVDPSVAGISGRMIISWGSDVPCEI